LGKDDTVVGSIVFKNGAAPGTNEMIKQMEYPRIKPLVVVLKRTAKFFISLLEKIERGEEV